MTRLIAVVTGLVVLLSASIASACPVCATREGPGSLQWVALAAFVLSPWFIAGYIAYWIRKNAKPPFDGGQ